MDRSHHGTMHGSPFRGKELKENGSGSGRETKESSYVLGDSSSKPCSRPSMASVNMYIVTGKAKKLPPHVTEVLYARRKSELRPRISDGKGLLSSKNLLEGVNCVLKSLPWEKKSHQISINQKDESFLSKPNLFKSRSKKKDVQSMDGFPPKSYQNLIDIVEKNPYGKITMPHTEEPQEELPPWVLYRLQESCRSTRFTLPSLYADLQDMNAQTYLEQFVVLPHAQRRRYDKVFNKFMDRREKCLNHTQLYIAINSMYANCFGQNNFETLKAILLVPDDLDDFEIESIDLFAGICALCDRLYWGSFIDSSVDTFFTIGQNRSFLECADFSNLKLKLKDLNISFQLKTLLFSLA